MTKVVEIFTDGACSGNPGPGGWGAVLRYDGYEKQLYGSEPHTTNNRMELMAAISALQSLKRPCKVVITTDSQYVKNGITKWIINWQKTNWRGSNGKVKNTDLWQQLLALTNIHQIEWHWVKGHAGHPENELADELARRGIEEIQ